MTWACSGKVISSKIGDRVRPRMCSMQIKTSPSSTRQAYTSATDIHGKYLRIAWRVMAPSRRTQATPLDHEIPTVEYYWGPAPDEVFLRGDDVFLAFGINAKLAGW